MKLEKNVKKRTEKSLNNYNKIEKSLRALLFNF